jgi:hypothetical protein
MYLHFCLVLEPSLDVDLCGLEEVEVDVDIQFGSARDFLSELVDSDFS